MSETGNEPYIWRSTSHCANNATCVEVAALPSGGAAMRDGKDPGGPSLHFDAEAWTAFIQAIKAGEFDLRHVP